jgi:hypothetical protein
MPLAGLIVGWDIATDVLFLNYWLNLFTIQFLARLHVNLSDGGMENNKIEINMQNTLLYFVVTRHTTAWCSMQV